MDIPRRESLAPPDGHNSATGLHTPGNVTPKLDDGEEEPTVPITLSGPQPLVHEAQALMEGIISSRMSKTTQRVRDIPPHILPFVVARRSVFVAAAEGADVNLTLNSRDGEVTVNGDREAVTRVVETIRATIEDLKINLTSVKVSRPKHQHRLLVGNAVHEILAKSNCVVVVAMADDPSEEVTIWGRGADLATGLSAVMEKVQSQHIHVFAIPGTTVFGKQVLAYFAHTGYIATLNSAHPNVSIHVPNHRTLESKQPACIDVIGEKPAVEAVVAQLSQIVSKLEGATGELEIDWLIHKFVAGKNAKRWAFR